jgi:hypothetical protein
LAVSVGSSKFVDAPQTPQLIPVVVEDDLTIGAGTTGHIHSKTQGFSLPTIRPRYWIAGTAALIGIILTFALFYSLNSVGWVVGQDVSSTASTTQVVEESGPIDLTPKAVFDERLILYDAYHALADGGDIDGDGNLKTKEGIQELRFTVNRFYEYIKKRQIDPNLELLYADLLTSLDLQSDFLTTVQRIDEDAATQTDKDAQETGFDSGFAGGTAAASIDNKGGSGGEKLLGGLAAGIMTWAIEDLDKKQELDDNKRRALEDANEQLQRGLSPIQARAANAIDNYVAQNNWPKGSDGKPIDPFHQLYKTLEDQYMKAKTPQEAVTAANAILDGARSLPPGSIYDGYRAYALWYAARSAYWAAVQEVKGQKWGVARASSADYAIRLCDAGLLQNCPASMHDEIQETKAWALASDGRLTDAEAAANTVFNKLKDKTDWFFADDSTGGFLYSYACLASCLGDMGTAFNDLKTDLGMSTSPSADIKKAMADPNLSDLRAAKPTEFDNLVKVKFVWSIGPGIFHDDIVVTNKSAFALHNVVLSATIASGGSIWTPTLKADLIEPGESQTWENAIPNPGGPFDTMTANLSCDENQ